MKQHNLGIGSFALRWSAIVGLALVGSFAAGGVPGDTECSDDRQFGASDYWFWEGYLGVKDARDVQGQRRGKLATDPSVCFHVELQGLNEPENRTEGYKRAIS